MYSAAGAKPPRRYTYMYTYQHFATGFNIYKFMKTITNIVLSHALFLAIFSFAAFALAQESGAPTLEDRQQAPREFSTSTNLKEKVTERRSQLQEKVQLRIKNLAANVSNRMEATISRLSSISNRIESRIIKLEAEGINVTEARKSLESAKLSLATAKAEISNIDEAVNSTIGSEDIKTNWKLVREKYLKIQSHLKTAHSEFKNTITILKEAINNKNITPTETSTSTDATTN